MHMQLDYDVGRAISIKFTKGDSPLAFLYNDNQLVKFITTSDKVARKILITDAVELGATKSKLARAFSMSRQTIDNYIEIKKHFGFEGLVHSYSPKKSTDIQKHRQESAESRSKGNKVKAIEEIRKAKRDARPKQATLPFQEPEVEESEQPYAEEHDWSFTRYAGIFSYIIMLIAQYDWLRLLQSFYGPIAKLFLVFVFMCARNIPSVEQIKNERLGEIARVLGFYEKPSRKRIRHWLYEAVSFERARHLLDTLFLYQIRSGIVGLWLWFTDNHLLSYSGRERIHKAYNTQRRLMMPGRTNMVTTDQSGRIVDFEIQEGKGDIRQRICDLAQKWENELPEKPVMVFDREVYGAEQFSRMHEQGIVFVTWDKNVNPSEMEALDEERFSIEFSQNNKVYRVFEGSKTFSVHSEGNTEQSLTLRRIYLWNVTSNRKTCGLSNATKDKMNTESCARAILCRWGASENAFKHLGHKHPLQYQPELIMCDSEYQDMANPELQEKKREIAKLKKELETIYKKLSKTKQAVNKDGTPRKNSAWSRLQQTKESKETKLETLKQEQQELPDRIDCSQEGMKRFKKIDSESKYLFDMVTASVWNVRKQMADWLLEYYKNKNEYVDLLYAITHCQGWVRSDADQVQVQLEPLEQPSRRAAQEQLCRKLTSLNAKTPNGKRMIMMVGNSPLMN